MQRARVTWPDAQVMANGAIRIPASSVWHAPVSGARYTEFDSDGWEVEIIPDTHDWETNDVAHDAGGLIFVMRPNGRWMDVLGMNREPVPPLTKYVPE